MLKILRVKKQPDSPKSMSKGVSLITFSLSVLATSGNARFTH